MDLKDVDVTKPWNSSNHLPISEWLVQEQTEEAKCRLKCMGNIVVPIQAHQASKMLAKMTDLIC